MGFTAGKSKSFGKTTRKTSNEKDEGSFSVKDEKGEVVGVISIPENPVPLSKMRCKPVVKERGPHQELVIIQALDGMNKTYLGASLAGSKTLFPDDEEVNLFVMDLDNNGSPTFQTIMENYPNVNVHRFTYDWNIDPGSKHKDKYPEYNRIFDQFMEDYTQALSHRRGVILIDSGTLLNMIAMEVVPMRWFKSKYPNKNPESGAARGVMRMETAHMKSWIINLLHSAKSTREVADDGNVINPGMHVVMTFRKTYLYEGAGANVKWYGKYKVEQFYKEWKYQFYTQIDIDVEDERGMVVKFRRDKVKPGGFFTTGTSIDYPLGGWEEIVQYRKHAAKNGRDLGRMENIASIMRETAPISFADSLKIQEEENEFEEGVINGT